MVSVCLPSDALLQHLPSYLGFSYFGRTDCRWLCPGTLSAAERSYPKSDVRGSGQVCQAATVQEWPRGATLHPRSGAAAERRHPASRSGPGPGGAILRLRSGAAGRRHLAHKARGGDPEEPPRARGQGRQLGGATHTQGQGQRPRVPGCDGAGTAGRS